MNKPPSHRIASVYSLLWCTLLLCLFVPRLSAQNVGVGTTTPTSKLSVSGNLAIGTGYTDTIGPADGAIIRGKTGLGTRQPNTTLDVSGGLATRLTQATVSLASRSTVASPAVITVGDASYLQISSDTSDPAIRVFTLTAGLQAGQHLFIENKTPAAAARVVTGGLVQLANDTLTLCKAYGITATHMLWTGSKWIDLGNNTNKVVVVTTTPCAAEPTTKVSFTYTGANQAWTVPAGVTMIKVKLWGGGGAGGNYGGGGGGYVSGYLAVTAGQSLSVIVGQGGSKTGVTVYGGGGKSNSTSGTGGGGGGRSAVQLSGTDLVTAGGGGGGGTSSYGGGGDTVGMNGALATGCANEFGKGGTPATGGAAGVACGSTAYTGTAGTQYTGGNASTTYAAGVRGGGGGAGYYGGGAGGSNYGSGGGGGSSYVYGLINNSCFTYKSAGGLLGTSSSSAAPGGTTDTDYTSGIGVGWGGGVTGANGLVVIYY